MDFLGLINLSILDGFLRDVRDIVQADEALFWRWNEDRDTLLPHAWSSEEAPRPQFFRVKEWGPLARWSARERIVTLDGSDEAPLLACAPVIGNPRGRKQHLGHCIKPRDAGPNPERLDARNDGPYQPDAPARAHPGLPHRAQLVLTSR